MAATKALDIDSIIERLLQVRGSRPGKQVQVSEPTRASLSFSLRRHPTHTRTLDTASVPTDKKKKKQKKKTFFSFFCRYFLYWC
jgi:hypothetical protein